MSTSDHADALRKQHPWEVNDTRTGREATLKHSRTTWHNKENLTEENSLKRWIEVRRENSGASTELITEETARQELSTMPTALNDKGQECSLKPLPGHRVVRTTEPGQIKYSWIMGTNRMHHLTYRDGTYTAEASSAKGKANSGPSVLFTEEDHPNMLLKDWVKRRSGLKEEDLVKISEIETELKYLGISPHGDVYKASKVVDTEAGTTTYEWLWEDTLYKAVAETATAFQDATKADAAESEAMEE